jgi:hypothetical protein
MESIMKAARNERVGDGVGDGAALDERAAEPCVEDG